MALHKALPIVLLLSTMPAPAADDTPPLPSAAPEAHGFSTERLDRLHGLLRRHVEEGRFAGFVALVARNGHIVDWTTYGHRDVEQRLPMERDTIFRIYSMSKIVTSVAALILLEEGRLKLSDPVGKYLPELAALKVWQGGSEEKPLLSDAAAPVTVRHLLTHTSGFVYGFGDAPLDKLYQKANPYAETSMKGFVGVMKTLPLAFAPGERWAYGFNTDIVGAIVEQASGQPFDRFVEERIFRPLKMQDTGFDVPAGKRARIARIYQKGKSGTLEPAEVLADVHAEPGRGFAAGGAGLFSTIGDYARFAQMLLNGGELDGARILGRKTIELMTANHLAHMAQPTMEPGGVEGFGLGGSVRISPAGPRPGSVGQFGWSGAATTYVNIDPQEQTVVLLFAQHFPYNEGDLFGEFSTLFYASLVK